jgi:hypothetical protein
MSQDLDCIFPRNSRIAYLEDNPYIYGDIPPSLMRPSSRQRAEDSIELQIQAKEDQLLRKSLAYSRSTESIDQRSYPDLAEEDYWRHQDELTRRQELRESLKLSAQDLEPPVRIDRRRSVREADRRLKMTPAQSTTPKTPKSKAPHKRQSSGKSRKSLHKRSRFSKCSTKSPYNKPTFSSLVKSIDTQKYTYQPPRHQLRRRSSAKPDLLGELLALADKHAGQCSSFREKFLRLMQRHS